jgi:hypothetical protein
VMMMVNMQMVSSTIISTVMSMMMMQDLLKRLAR